MSENGSVVHVETVRDLASYECVRDRLHAILDRMKHSIRLPTQARVLIKLNLCLLKGPETGATVDPRVAKALVEWFTGNWDVAKIYLAEADATHLGAEMAFRALGWREFFTGVERVEFLNLSEDETVPVKARYFEDFRMSRTMMEADCLVSLAKLKTHTQQKITCIMKNQFGAIPYKYKIVYHSRLAEAIVDATVARTPDLCLIDGLVAMEGNGPTNGIPRVTKLLLASNDPVSMDHYCARVMGFDPLSIPHLKLALEQNLGHVDYEVIGNPLNPLNQRFKNLPRWKEMLKKGIGMVKKGTINEET